jgi:gamma-tubulin complex component 2
LAAGLAGAWQGCTNLCCLALQRAAESGEETTTIGSFPVQVQEMLIVQDLLSVLMGIDGKYIRIKVTSAEPGLAIRPDATLDLSLADLVDRILPLTDYYVRIVRFVDLRHNYEFGLVNHALCGAVRELLREYLILIAQLEHQLALSQLSLQKLWFYVQPAIQTLKALNKLVIDIETDGGGKADRGTTLRGGMLLNLLHTHSVAAGGEQHTSKLLAFVLQESAAPYLSMLQSWIHHGIVQDPYGEFMVEERPKRAYFDDSYWEKRYVKRDKHVASFLADKDLVDKILNTGKYLTVLRECGHAKQRRAPEPADQRQHVWSAPSAASDGKAAHQQMPAPAALTYSANTRVYAQLVQEAYAASSQQVLQLLVLEKQLLHRLSSIKRFFLLQQGDWLVHFLDLADEELIKPASQASKTRIESMLSLALVTAAPADQERENVSCSLMSSSALDEVLYVISIDGSERASQSRHQHVSSSTSSLSGASRGGLTGHDAFSLTYTVDWPLNIVFSRKTMTKYRWLFRHLFLYKVRTYARARCSLSTGRMCVTARKHLGALALIESRINEKC